MTDTALWERLDVPGHDAARLAATASGWQLAGTAVFLHAGKPARLGYTLDLDPGWATVSGRVRGFLGAAAVDRLAERRDGAWFLDGAEQPGLGHLRDLDLGFTPATNLQQLRRIGLAEGQAAELPVAWLDIDAPSLVELGQTYRRRDRSSFDYAAPAVPYRAVLELADNGFVRSYPGLWRMVG